MSSPKPFILRATVAPLAATALRHTLQQATPFIREHDPDADVFIVQETSLGRVPAHRLHVEQFTLVVSRAFSALLLTNPSSNGTPTNNDSTDNGQIAHDQTRLASAMEAASIARNVPVHDLPTPSNEDGGFDIELIFDSGAIADFLKQLMMIIPKRNTLRTSLKRALRLVQPNQPNLQSQFTLRVIVELTKLLSTNVTDSIDIVEAEQPQQYRQNRTIVSTPSSEKQHVLQHVTQQTQSADRAKSEFLATMSHELRTPLTYILGMSATLLRWSKPGAQEAIPERQRRYLQNIHDQGEHLLELINDLLDLSQLESGRLGLELQDISLSLLIQQSLNVYRKKAQLKGVTLELDSHITAESDHLTADPRRLQQVVSNLLSNAIKFTPQSGKVTVRLSTDEHLVEIQIRDTGIGISEHHQALIFQKFKQLDSSYHRQYEGTGLGLALTKQLVDLHGGWIECDSTLGVGTVFTVKLPRHPFSRHSTVRRAKSPTAANQSLGRIVLMDDDDESGHFVSDMLTAAGYQLVWVLEGLTAIGQLEMLQPSLVIINGQLIDRSAGTPNIIRMLRQNPITKRAKIMVLVHGDRSPDQVHDGTAGADLVLCQSPQPEELLHKVGILMTVSSSKVTV